MIWAVLLLKDQETLQTYEEYARESYYEVEGDQPPPPPTNASTRKPQQQDTNNTRQWGAARPRGN